LRHERIREYFFEKLELFKNKRGNFYYIPREENFIADGLYATSRIIPISIVLFPLLWGLASERKIFVTGHLGLTFVLFSALIASL